jgi:hypothetical protein
MVVVGISKQLRYEGVDYPRSRVVLTSSSVKKVAEDD